MLEHGDLRVEPLRRGVHGWVRLIRSAATMTLLGYAMHVRFGNWIKTSGYTLHEEPDGSLLAKVGRRRWFTPMIVTDADDKTLVKLQGPILRLADGRLLAELQATRHGGRCRAANGVDYADWTSDSVAVVLRFHASVVDEPLIKLAILAAVVQTV